MHAISNMRAVSGESKTYVTYSIRRNNIGTVSESLQAEYSFVAGRYLSLCG